MLNFIMLQDISALKPGVFTEPLFGNSPLWSLSYEWWFYMLFFIHFIFYNIALIISLFGLITYFYFYNQISLILMYYYIWFSGAFILFALVNKQLNTKVIYTISFSYLLVILLYVSLFIYNKSIASIGVHPILELRHYSVALLILLFGIFFYKKIYVNIKNNYLYTKVIYYSSLLAPISFSFYVFHYPIKNYFQSFTEYNNVLLLFITLSITVIFSYIVEVKLYKLIRNKL